MHPAFDDTKIAYGAAPVCNFIMFVKESEALRRRPSVWTVFDVANQYVADVDDEVYFVVRFKRASVITSADAVMSKFALGGCACTTANGDIATVAYMTSSDAGTQITASGRDGTAADSNRAAYGGRGGIICWRIPFITILYFISVNSTSCSDAGGLKSAMGRDGAAADEDVAACSTITAADAGSLTAAYGHDGTACDGDVTARGLSAAADASRPIEASGRDGAARDINIATGGIRVAADTRARTVAAGVERA